MSYVEPATLIFAASYREAQDLAFAYGVSKWLPALPHNLPNILPPPYQYRLLVDFWNISGNQMRLVEDLSDSDPNLEVEWV